MPALCISIMLLCMIYMHFFWLAMCFVCVIFGLHLRFHLKPFYLSVYVRHLIKRHYFYCEIHCKLRVKNKCVQ